MRIIVTDSGYIWNHENPFLKQFKESVIVVCLSGKKVTDEFDCIISPYQVCGLGATQYGVQSAKYKALVSIKSELISKCGYHDDVLFLTDSNPESLYPYFAVRNKLNFSPVHLCTMSPFPYQTKRQHNAYNFLMSDFKQLKSLFYWDIQNLLDELEGKTLSETREYLTNLYAKFAMKVLDGILDMRRSGRHKYYFDFASESYVPIDIGFTDIQLDKKNKEINSLKCSIAPMHSTLGRLMMPDYPSTKDYDKESIEYLPPRVDGKIVCNVLKAQRIEIARVNNIPFETVDCPSVGPCAGTCERCDEELAYLTKKLNKIPEEKRLYTKFDPEWEMILCQEEIKQ